MEKFVENEHDIQLMCDKLEQQGHDWLILSIGRYPDTNHMCSGSTLGLDFLRQRTDVIDDFLVYVRGKYDGEVVDENIEQLPVPEDTSEIYVATVDTVGTKAEQSLETNTNLQMNQILHSMSQELNQDEEYVVSATVNCAEGSPDGVEQTYCEPDLVTVGVEDNTNAVEVETIIDVSELLKETKCNVCCRQFSSQRALSSHVRIHKKKLVKSIRLKQSTSTGEFSCEICGKCFKYESYLMMHKDRKNSCIDESRKHISDSDECIKYQGDDGVERTTTISAAIKESTEKVPYICVICGRSVAGSLSQVRRHIIGKHSSDAQHKCEYCQKAFKVKDSLIKHKARVHSNKDFVAVPCKLCDKQFETEKQMKMHMILKCSKRDRNCKCAVCGFKASGPASLERHLRTHSDVKPFSCEECEKRFSTKENLNCHIVAMHAPKQEFVCQTCDTTFPTQSQYRYHMLKHSSPKFFCDICDKHFFDTSQFRSHALIHTSSVPFTCEFCGKTFRWAKNLTIHRRNHTGEKPYNCQTCGKSYTSLDSLKVHTSTHKGTKHVCDVCGRMYSHIARLRQHVKAHRNQQRTFACSFCEETFPSLQVLKTHLIKQHEDKQSEIQHGSRIKLHKCSIGNCSKLCVTQQKLKRHIMVAHTNARPYKCSHCSMPFNDENNKRRHEKRHLTSRTGPKKNIKNKGFAAEIAENTTGDVQTSKDTEEQVIETDENIVVNKMITLAEVAEEAVSISEGCLTVQQKLDEHACLYSSVLPNSSTQTVSTSSLMPNNNSPLPSISSQFLQKQSTNTNDYLTIVKYSGDTSGMYGFPCEQTVSSGNGSSTIQNTPIHRLTDMQFHQVHSYAPSGSAFGNLPPGNDNRTIYAVPDPSVVSSVDVAQEHSEEKIYDKVLTPAIGSNFPVHNFIQNL